MGRKLNSLSRLGFGATRRSAPGEEVPVSGLPCSHDRDDQWIAPGMTARSSTRSATRFIPTEPVPHLPRSIIVRMTRLSRTLALWIALPAVGWLACGPGNDAGTAGTPPPPSDLRITTVATGLDTPWDLAWGPDDAIWVTERGGRISRVNPTSGQVTPVGQLTVTESGESGLMGMAFHPSFATQPYVFAMHSYSGASGLRNRLVRMRFENGALGAPETLIDDIPASGIHDGSRLAVGRDGFLYVTTGDASNPALARDRSSLAGKVLRVTLTGQPAPGNPFASRVHSLGHRNPQGIVFHPTRDILYVTEHGPGDNDEVNLIEPGRDYGWPEVRGRCDDDAPQETVICQRDGIAEPLAIWTPTIAPSGVEFYDSSLIPAWRNSLLFTTLKGSALVRLSMSADGRTVTAQETLYEGQFGRLRDVLIGPRGEVYLATSNRDGRGSPTGNDDRIVKVEP